MNSAPHRVSTLNTATSDMLILNLVLIGANIVLVIMLRESIKERSHLINRIIADFEEEVIAEARKELRAIQLDLSKRNDEMYQRLLAVARPDLSDEEKIKKILSDHIKSMPRMVPPGYDDILHMHHKAAKEAVSQLQGSQRTLQQSLMSARQNIYGQFVR